MFIVWGADRFVFGAAASARSLEVSPLLIGLTIVGFGTSAPEMLVSGMAAWTGAPEMGIGNAIGSNITNIALVLGIAALVRPLEIHSQVLKREMPLLLVTMVVAYGLLYDRVLDRVDGAFLLIAMVVTLLWVVKEGKRSQLGEEDVLSKEFEDEFPEDVSTLAAFAWLVLGFLVLFVGSRVFVWGAEQCARHFGVSELVIGLSLVAFGTSLPELAASITAALRNEHDIAVGNIVGSNMFNLLGVLSLPGLIAPGSFDELVVMRDYPIMFLLSLALVLLALCGQRKIQRWAGALLVLSFGAYLNLLF